MHTIDELDAGSRPSTASSAASQETVESNDITGLHRQWVRRRERLRTCQVRLPTLRRRLADFEHAFRSNSIPEEDSGDAASSDDDHGAAADDDWEPRAQSRAPWEGHPELASAHDKRASKLAQAYAKIARYEQLVGQARERWDRAVQVSRNQRDREARIYRRRRRREEAKAARQMAELDAQRRRRMETQREAERQRRREQQAQDAAAAMEEHERQKAEKRRKIAEHVLSFLRR